MAEQTNIEWCDATFNPWTGCSKVSPGCDHCYAEGWSKRAGAKVGKWGPGAPRVRTTLANWANPLAWNAKRFMACSACGWRGECAAELIGCGSCGSMDLDDTRRRVFCASLADVFDNEVPDQWRQDLFDLILATPNLDWLLLTKRIGNVGNMLPVLFDFDKHYPNVWLGATIVNQAEADRDIPKLLAVPAAVRFLSVEPMLGPVDLTNVAPPTAEGRVWHGIDSITPANRELRGCIDWIICGGESGPNARPMHPDWARSLRDQCQAAGVPYLFKQWGEWATVAESPVHPEATRLPGNLCKVTHDGITVDHYVAISTDGGRRRYELRRIGKKAAGRVLDGREWNEAPAP